MGFMPDVLTDGRAVRGVFTVVDDCSREGPLAGAAGLLMRRRCRLSANRRGSSVSAAGRWSWGCDKGPEYNNQRFRKWGQGQGIKLCLAFLITGSDKLKTIPIHGR